MVKSPPEGVPEGYYEVPIGEPDIKKEGKDITILTVGEPCTVPWMAKTLEEKYGFSAEVIDTRTSFPSITTRYWSHQEDSRIPVDQ